MQQRLQADRDERQDQQDADAGDDLPAQPPQPLRQALGTLFALEQAQATGADATALDFL